MSAMGAKVLVAAAIAVAAVLGGSASGAAAAPSDGVVDVRTTLGLEGGAGAATGIVLTSTGEVLTNNHVVRGATSIRVTDPRTGRSYRARVVGYSVANDVAVLQLAGASGLHPIPLGDSSTLRVGQRVTAVGNARGRGGTPASSSGRIVALGRTITAGDEQGSLEQLTGLIVMSAPLQPGDSGGPLLDASGRAIGIDTAATPSFRFRAPREGYAIPIDRALRFARQIVARRASSLVHVGSTPFLGVTVAPSPRGGAGAAVVDVLAGSPADGAGIAAGDTLLGLDMRRIATYATLQTLLLRHHAGDTVRLRWVDAGGTAHTAAVRTIAGPPQ